MGDCAEDSAGFKQCAAGGAGVALSGAAPAGVQGLDQGALGCEREQSQGAVLFADRGGEKAACGGTRELGSTGRSGEPGAGGDLKCSESASKQVRKSASQQVSGWVSSCVEMRARIVERSRY